MREDSTVIGLAPFAYCAACGFYIYDEVEKTVFTECASDLLTKGAFNGRHNHAWKNVSTAIEELREIERSLR